MGGVWITHVEIEFVLSLAFGQHKLRYILCPFSHEIGLVKRSWDIFWFLDGIEGVWSTNVEMHFVSWLARELYSQHMS